MSIRIDVDITKAVKDIQFARKQIPFLVAKTLTDVAKKAQGNTKQSLKTQSRFTLRNTWTESSIRFKPATKDDPQADVHTDFSRRSNATDYLALQEENYVKISQHTYLCIPTDALYRLVGGKSRIIPDSWKPAALFNYVDKNYSYTATKGRNKGQSRSVGNGKSYRGLVFFTATHGKLLHTKSGARGIWARPATDTKGKAVLLYVLVRHTKSVRGRFHMEELVRQTVENDFAATWDKNWNDILERGIKL